jgi:hypothetical protein
MDNSAVAHQLKILALSGAGLLVAVLVGWNIGNANYAPLLFGLAIIAVACLALFSGRFFWVITIASSFLGGTFPVLGGSFTPFQILMGIGIAKFVVEDMVLRRTRLSFGNRFDLALMLGFMAILTVHGIHDRFGMRFLGSSVWGGRYYVNVFVGLAAFLVVQSIPMYSKMWSKLPYLVLAVVTFDLAIAAITTIFPASIYKIYPLYSAVSLPGLEEIVTGGPSVTGRIGAFGNFGFIVIILILASAPLTQILNLANLSRLSALLIGAVTVLYSGYRTSVFNTIVVILVAGIRDLRFKVIALLPLLAIALLTLSFINANVMPLPKQIQRGLAFLPGKWDAEMKNSATASNDFRRQVWTTWMREFFPVHPWLGRGFGFGSEWAEPSVYEHDPEANRRSVEIGQVHNGFLSTVDALGIIGSFFFVIWNVTLLGRAVSVPFIRNDPNGRTLRFLALYLATSIICYWMGAQDLGAFLPQEFALASVFLKLKTERRRTEPVQVLSPFEEPAASPDRLVIA